MIQETTISRIAAIRAVATGSIKGLERHPKLTASGILRGPFAAQFDGLVSSLAVVAPMITDYLPPMSEMANYGSANDVDMRPLTTPVEYLAYLHQIVQLCDDLLQSELDT